MEAFMGDAENETVEQPARSGRAANDSGSGTGQATSTATSASGWSFLSLAAIVAGVIWVTVYVVSHYTNATDAGTILGIVIPVFATVGAAIFGVTVAYQAGSRTGQQTGRTQGRNEAADVIEGEVENTREAIEPLVRKIEERGTSRAGEETFSFGDPSAPTQIAFSDLSEVRQRLERLRGVARGLRTR
jgi:hypothetical protein